MPNIQKIAPSENKSKSKKKIKRHRRRRKNHQQQQLKANSSSNHHNSNSKQHKRKKHDTSENSNTHDLTFTHSSAASIWRKMYETTIKWHQEHQMNYWRHLAERRRTELVKMQAKLKKLKSNLKHLKKRNTKITEKQQVQMTDVRCSSVRDITVADEPYLEFMEVTERHRIDLAQQRMKSENED